MHLIDKTQKERMAEDNDWSFGGHSFDPSHLFSYESIEKMKAYSFGQTPLCNGKPETAPHIGNFCFPICWRCLAVSIGAIITTVVFGVLRIIPEYDFAGFLISGVCIIPCSLDGILSYFTRYPSRNSIRIITGIAAGFGFRMIAYYVLRQ